MFRRTAVFTAILLLIFLAACRTAPAATPTAVQPAALPAPAATPTFTPPAEPPATVVAAVPTQELPPKRTAVSSPTPRPTRWPTATRRPLPTPITPAAPAAAYRLSPWSEADVLPLLAEAESGATIYESEALYGWSAYGTFTAVMLQEALWRFPGFAARQEISPWPALRWAQWWAVDDEWLIITLLEEALNAGWVAPDGLLDYLDDRGLYGLDMTSADGIFGDGRPATLLTIDRGSGSFYDEIFLILTGSAPGSYRLTPLRGWEGGSHVRIALLGSEDRNGNGRPEIGFIKKNGSSGLPGRCWVRINLFEWQGEGENGRFANLAWPVPEFVTGYDTSDCDNLWRFELTPTGAKADLIETIRYKTWYQCPPVVVRSRYAWDGAAYSWQESAAEPLHDDGVSALCALLWANVAGGENDQAVAIVEAGLAQWPAEMAERWGPAAQDFFHFQLGMWYDWRGQSELARQTLLSVRDAPANGDYQMASRLAAAYLEQMAAGGLLLRCQAAEEVLRADRNDFPPSETALDWFWQTMLSRWGFAPPGWLYYLGSLCPTSTLLRLDIAGAQLTEADQVAAWLADVGLTGLLIEPGEVNGDGLADWLVVTESWSGRPHRELLLLIQGEAGFTAVNPDGFSAEAPLSLAHRLVRHPVDGRPVNAVLLGDSLSLFLVMPGRDGYEVERVDSAIDVLDFTLAAGETELVLTLSGAEGTETRRLTADSAYFSPHGPSTQDQELAALAELVFQQNDLPAAIPRIETLLAAGIEEADHPRPPELDVPEPPPLKESYLRYLLALAYEMSGDEQQAVQLYWQLWRDFPENPFSLAIRRKLIPRVP